MDYAAAYGGGRCDSIGSYSAYLELHQPSSFDLLRTSILHSIRGRDFQQQGFLEKRYDGTAESYSNPKFTVVEVKNIDLKDNESDLSDLEQSNSVELRQKRQIHQKVPENGDRFEPINTKNMLSINSALDSNINEFNDNSATLSNNDYPKLKESDKNSIKLARRKFSNTIFEDCSTYNITSSNVELDEDNHLNDSSKQNESNEINNFADDNAKELTPVSSDFTLLRNPEEHTSLCDTFFPHVNDNDSQSPTPNFELGYSSLVEKDTGANEEVTGDVGETGVAGPSKRRHSKRHRKRSRKKSKAKKPFIYECSKCGASYVIPTKGMNKVACCLHCDLWVPVEPVFVRREKTTWNTCQIC